MNDSDDAILVQSMARMMGDDTYRSCLEQLSNVQNLLI